MKVVMTYCFCHQNWSLQSRSLSKRMHWCTRSGLLYLTPYIRYTISGTILLIRYFWYTISGSQYLVHYIRYTISGTHLVYNIRYTISGTIFLVRYFWYTISGSQYLIHYIQYTICLDRNGNPHTQWCIILFWSKEFYNILLQGMSLMILVWISFLCIHLTFII